MKLFRKWGVPVFLLLATAGLFWYGLQYRKQWKKEHIYVELRAIQLPKGWGYDILANGRVFIHQDCIPDVGGNRVFRSREDALAVGQIVYQRTIAGKTPMVSEAEIRKLNVYIPELTAAK